MESPLKGRPSGMGATPAASSETKADAPSAGFVRSGPDSGKIGPSEASAAAQSSAESLKDGLKETMRTASGAVRDQATQLAQDIGHELRKTGDRQLSSGAEAIRRFARVIDNAARELEEQSPTVARSAHEAANRVNWLSDNIGNRNIAELIDTAAQLARTQPVLFLGGSVVAGFALARFLKSSAHNRSDGRSYGQAGQPTS